MAEDKNTLKEMCELFEVTPRTLRYYEYIELIAPEKRGRTRYYGAKEKARLTLIKRGRKVGFSLEEVRQWLELYDQDPGQKTQMETLYESAEKQKKELEIRKVELDEALKELDKLQAFAREQLEKG